jgi:hypothetical protein
LSYFNLRDNFELVDIVPENIPLILKRKKKYRIKNPEHVYNTNLNDAGVKRWKELLNLPNNSFERRQNSHMIMYFLRKK